MAGNRWCDACIRSSWWPPPTPCCDPFLPTWVVYRAPLSDLHLACGFFVNSRSLPHFIELNSGQARRISQIRYQGLGSHRETIKPWNMCLAASQGGSTAWEVGTVVHPPKHARNLMHTSPHKYRLLHTLLLYSGPDAGKNNPLTHTHTHFI